MPGKRTGFAKPEEGLPLSELATVSLPGMLKAEIERILHGSTFSGSGSLRHLLTFLADWSARNPGQPIKEKDIAAAVFGRADAFDPQIDSIVRVHVGRLRSKLAEYYVNEGTSDDVAVEIPRGSYVLSWHARETARRTSEVPLPSGQSAPLEAITGRPGRRAVLYWAVLPAVLVIGGFLAGRWTTSNSRQPPEGALRWLWQGFARSREEPLIVFGNPRYVATASGGMRVARDDDDPREALIDGMTTVGHLFGVLEVSRLLTSFGKTPIVKRAQLLTWDDAVETNLIVIGNPTSVKALKDFPFLQKFQFKDRYVEPHIGVGAIFNRSPGKDEEPVYFGPDTRPYLFDYAVIALLPGFKPTKRTLVLSGMTSRGTQAAAEFVCQESQVQQLLSKLSKGRNVTPVFFEALVRVTVSGGVPVQSEILIAHNRAK